MYTTNVYKMYTKCIPHFDKLLYTFCIATQLKELWQLFLYTNVYKSLLKCEIHFVYKHFHLFAVHFVAT